MKYILLIAALVMAFPVILDAQESSAGKCYSVDYELWKLGNYADIHGNCGTDPIFNTGNSITLEVWVRSYLYVENKKIMGKMLGDQTDRSYVVGHMEQNIYSEVFTPGGVEVARVIPGPIPGDSAWVHFATTYDGTAGKMINYLNGVNVGEASTFPNSPVSDNDGPFIIGRAPWDFSYLFNGDIDEIRVWNIAKTEEQIKKSLFISLKGDENGLVAYYNFDQPTDSIFYDQTQNTNNGVIKKYEDPAFSWADSYAPVGDSIMGTMQDVSAAWYGREATGYNQISAMGGLSFGTSISAKEFWKYLVAGRNNALGTTQDSIPGIAPTDFKRLKRSWYINQGGSFKTDLTFDLRQCAAASDTLESYQADSLYTLLKLDLGTGRYEPIYSASATYFAADYYILEFNGVELSDGYYTVGHCSDRLAYPASVNELSNTESLINIFPNPAKDFITITNSKAGKFEIFNISGSKILESEISEDAEQFNIEQLEKGIYFIRVSTDKEIKSNKIIIQ